MSAKRKMSMILMQFNRAKDSRNSETGVLYQLSPDLHPGKKASGIQPLGNNLLLNLTKAVHGDVSGRWRRVTWARDRRVSF